MSLPTGQDALSDPYAERGPIRMPMLVVLFAVTVPAFFLAGFLALWLVETDVWLPGEGRIIAQDTHAVYVRQAGTIAEIADHHRGDADAPLAAGAVFEQDALIIRMDDADLQQHQVELTTAMADCEARIQTLAAQLVAANHSTDQAAAARRQPVLEARQQAERVHLAGLRERLRVTQQRMAEREHRMPFTAQLVWAGDYQPGQWVEAGTLIATAHGLGDRLLTITVDEDVFSRVEIGTGIRFSTSVVSVYQYDYYWGDVTERRIVQVADDNFRYELMATLQPGDHALPIEQLPLGSTGQVDIIHDRKSLLAQIVGW